MTYSGQVITNHKVFMECAYCIYLYKWLGIYFTQMILDLAFKQAQAQVFISLKGSMGTPALTK